MSITLAECTRNITIVRLINWTTNPYTCIIYVLHMLIKIHHRYYNLWTHSSELRPYGKPSVTKFIDAYHLNVTGFAKRGLLHTSNLLTLAIHNFRLETANTLKFGQQ